MVEKDISYWSPPVDGLVRMTTGSVGNIAWIRYVLLKKQDKFTAAKTHI